MPKGESVAIACAFNERRRKTMKRTWTDGNTVWLHGNRIAWRDEQGVVWVGLCGYNTLTTRDRVNAILDALGFSERFYQKNFALYYAGRLIDAADEIQLTGVLGSLALEAERRLAQAA